jgi:hypothetical protein
LQFLISGSEKMRINSAGAVTKPYQPAFFAVPTAGFTTVNIGSYFPFNSLNTTFCGSNRNGGYSTSNYYYTAPVAGLYMFYVQLYLDQNGGTSVTWFKNGVQQAYGDAALAIFTSQNTSTTSWIINGSVTFELAAGDYVGIQPRTGSNSVYFYGGHSTFFGYLIG